MILPHYRGKREIEEEDSRRVGETHHLKRHKKGGLTKSTHPALILDP